jgi:DNA-binding NtrC family response regulator
LTGPGDRRAPAPRLLVVDDDEVVLRAFERTFRRAYQVRTASSGALALAALEEQEVDVLITDFSMPVMNGLDLLRQVVIHHPAVARLILTAHADVPEVVALKQQGLVSAVLMKPWSREEVEGAVTQALRLASMRRAVAGLQVRVAPAQR